MATTGFSADIQKRRHSDSDEDEVDVVWDDGHDSDSDDDDDNGGGDRLSSKRHKFRDEDVVAALSAPVSVHTLDLGFPVIHIEYGETNNPEVRAILDKIIHEAKRDDGALSGEPRITLELGGRFYTLVIKWSSTKSAIWFELGEKHHKSILSMAYDPEKTCLKINAFYYGVPDADRMAMHDNESWGGYGARGMFFVKWVAVSLGASSVELDDCWCGHGTAVFDSKQLKTLVDVMRLIDNRKRIIDYDFFHGFEETGRDYYKAYAKNRLFYDNIYKQLVNTKTLDRVLKHGWPLKNEIVKLSFEYDSNYLSSAMKAIRDGKPLEFGAYVLAPDRFQKEYKRLKTNGTLEDVIKYGYYAQFGFMKPDYDSVNLVAKKIINTKSRF